MPNDLLTDGEVRDAIETVKEEFHRMRAEISLLTTQKEALQAELNKLTDPDGDLPQPYLMHKLKKVVPVFQEARDALTAINETQMKLHGISPTLAERMDEAGTYNIVLWITGKR